MSTINPRPVMRQRLEKINQNSMIENRSNVFVFANRQSLPRYSGDQFFSRRRTAKPELSPTPEAEMNCQP